MKIKYAVLFCHVYPAYFVRSVIVLPSSKFFFFLSFIFYESLNVFLLFKSSFAQCGFEAALQQNVYILVSGKMILVCSEMDYLQ